MQSRATKAYEQAIENENRSVAHTTRNLNILKVNRKMIGKVLRSLDKLITGDDRMYLMANNSLPHVYISMHDLGSFKDDRLMRVLDHLAETMDDMKTEDWAASINRDYRFTSSTHSAVVSAYVKSDSPTCRKVLVGTELQTVEKFEIVCD